MKANKIKPYSEVEAKLGQASTAWAKLTGHIRFYYEMDELWEEGNPTHKHHSNLRFRRGGKTLITLCIREGYFIAAIVLGKEEREKFEEQRKKFGEAVRKEYDDTEVFHDGKWLGFDVYDESLIDDIINLLQIKRKPNRKVLPKSLESCGRLDIGLSHQEITSILFS
ncbi:MAG: DUF3788 domain-containing protein [Bacteroidetes bacterium]|nr:DUF3788 domain-containing protein [Bacteroidota bacterium]MCL2303126.1 DUF3788 domain-containing protein [Lentimicrobiaceae bacterium]